MRHKECRGCADRKPACHDHCAKYHAEELRKFIARKKQKEQMRTQYDLDMCAWNRANKKEWAK